MEYLESQDKKVIDEKFTNKISQLLMGKMFETNQSDGLLETRNQQLNQIKSKIYVTQLTNIFDKNIDISFKLRKRKDKDSRARS